MLPESEEIFEFVREYDGREMVVAVNFSLEAVKVPEIFVGKKLILCSESEIEPSEFGALEARIYE